MRGMPDHVDLVLALRHIHGVDPRLGVVPACIAELRNLDFLRSISFNTLLHMHSTWRSRRSWIHKQQPHYDSWKVLTPFSALYKLH